MTPKKSAATGDNGELTSAMFHILLVLAEGERHGYAIMKEVEKRTEGAVELGPGTLYRSIKQLVTTGLISETGAPQMGGDRRRSYCLTSTGKTRAAAEARRLQGLVQWAESARLLHGGQV